MTPLPIKGAMALVYILINYYTLCPFRHHSRKCVNSRKSDNYTHATDTIFSF
ncbi:hypothetical protein SAMN02745132_01277 [Enterovibrio nigricans DSM 22720]|uniref:Uncharacterized protein n=1 Tax=Enterovibrio nigricans DSM 22720 TaxID=1121868 RepID=A0A1T4UBH4_9GAMM|nr:hypothetical protein SAMN02745132_01277 [Enterovibrio nigricans DSM 22720]